MKQKDLSKISSLKLDKINKAISFVKEENSKENVISKVILFGSAITNECRPNSDIDLCLVSDYDCSNETFFQIYGRLPLVIDDSCDILLYSRLKGNLKDEIDRKGIVIYES